MQLPPDLIPPGYRPPLPKEVRFAAIPDAWNLYSIDFGQWIAAVFVAAFIVGMPTFIIYSVAAAIARPFGFGFNSAELVSRQETLQIALAFVLLPVAVGGIMLSTGLQHRALLQARRRRADVWEMFRLQGRGKHVLVCAVVLALIPLPLQLYVAYMRDYYHPNALFEPSSLMVLFGLIVFTVIFGCCFAFAPLIAVDQKLPAFAALKRSYEVFSPHLLPLVGVLLCSGLIAASGILACCAGLLFTAPIGFTIYGVIYNDFFREKAVVDVEEVTGFNPEYLG